MTLEIGLRVLNKLIDTFVEAGIMRIRIERAIRRVERAIRYAMVWDADLIARFFEIAHQS